jgi:hypothetical protein
VPIKSETLGPENKRGDRDRDRNRTRRALSSDDRATIAFSIEGQRQGRRLRSEGEGDGGRRARRLVVPIPPADRKKMGSRSTSLSASLSCRIRSGNRVRVDVVCNGRKGRAQTEMGRDADFRGLDLCSCFGTEYLLRQRVLWKGVLVVRIRVAGEWQG